jgi:selT/selW/selH-like putative selenoprotein
LEAEILQEFPAADVRLVESSGGVFEVTCNDTLIFSKRDLGRHAHPGEVMALLRPTGNP